MHRLTLIIISSMLLTEISIAGPITELKHKFRDAIRKQADYHKQYHERVEVAEVSSRLFFRGDRQRHHTRTSDSSKRYFRSSSVPSKIEAHGRNTFVFNPKRLTWGAYDPDGKLVNSGRASGGAGYCRDVNRRCRTPVGHFSVYRKGHAGCRSSKYPIGRGGAPMPYCMFFRGGYAIHGSPDVPNYNASHGCIRVPPSDAKWLHRNFINHGTKVIVRPY